MKTIADKLIKALHDEFGYCGHCSKRKCAGRKSHSILPSKLDTDGVLKIIDSLCDHEKIDAQGAA